MSMAYIGRVSSLTVQLWPAVAVRSSERHSVSSPAAPARITIESSGAFAITDGPFPSQRVGTSFAFVSSSTERASTVSARSFAANAIWASRKTSPLVLDRMA